MGVRERENILNRDSMINFLRFFISVNFVYNMYGYCIFVLNI